MILKYCTQCASPLNKGDDTAYVCDGGHAYWNEPRVGTSVVMLRDGKVLVVRRKREPYKDKYCFPGGFVEFDEQPADGAAREAREETGVELEGVTLIDARTVGYETNETACSLVYVADGWHGDIKAGDDAASTVWKPIDFIENPDFAWHYPGLAAKLKALDAQRGASQR